MVLGEKVERVELNSGAEFQSMEVEQPRYVEASLVLSLILQSFSCLSSSVGLF